MNKPVRVSAFLLERYRLGEITYWERRRVEKALSQNPALTATLEEMDRSDRDFRERFPPERFFSQTQKPQRFRVVHSRRIPPPVLGLCAAALVLAVVLPPLLMRNTGSMDFMDRIKGGSDTGRSAELGVYLKGDHGNNSEGDDLMLADHAAVREGDTVQLVYRVPANTSGERHGVIFSVDGRSVVTLHFPYNPGQATSLVSGRAVPLDEAYTLDDAPDYEIFFFVVGNKPLEARSILRTAEQLALRIKGNPQDALRQGNNAFKGYELTVLTLRKE